VAIAAAEVGVKLGQLEIDLARSVCAERAVVQEDSVRIEQELAAQRSVPRFGGIVIREGPWQTGRPLG
jgi:hypothetical protein